MHTQPAANVTLSQTTATHRTKDQAEAFARMLKLGTLHFASKFEPGGLMPRFSPLLAGPTGSGKSRLCRDVATTLGAHYHRLTAGEWIPVGAKGTATTDELMKLALVHPRLVLHVDELDKFQPQFQNEWSRSCANSLWDVLEGVLPWGPAALEKHGKDRLHKLARGIWCVGSGTWQDLFHGEHHKRTLGFGGATISAPAGGSRREHFQQKIQEKGIIPAELLARFSSEILILSYPAPSEAMSLLGQDAWPERAEKVGYPLAERLGVLLPKAGFRALESVIAEICLLEFDRNPPELSADLPKPRRSMSRLPRKRQAPASCVQGSSNCEAEGDTEEEELPEMSDEELAEACAEAGIQWPDASEDDNDDTETPAETSMSSALIGAMEPALALDYANAVNSASDSPPAH